MLSQHRGLGIRTPSCTEIRKAKIVHVVAIGGAESFSCGVRIGDDFEKISGSQFLDLRKCKRWCPSQAYQNRRTVCIRTWEAAQSMRKSWCAEWGLRVVTVRSIHIHESTIPGCVSCENRAWSPQSLRLIIVTFKSCPEWDGFSSEIL